jgi:hypothetical protein
MIDKVAVLRRLRHNREHQEEARSIAPVLVRHRSPVQLVPAQAWEEIPLDSCCHLNFARNALTGFSFLQFKLLGRSSLGSGNHCASVDEPVLANQTINHNHCQVHPAPPNTLNGHYHLMLPSVTDYAE